MAIKIDDFLKVEMRVGLILEAEIPEGSEKLIREVVDFGEIKHEVRQEQPTPQRDIRVIYSGIKKWYAPEDLVGKKFVYVVNLEPRPMLGEESNGMILAVEGEERKPVLLQVPDDVPTGAAVR